MIEPEKTALLVIDMQNDFVKEGAVLEVKGIRKELPKLKSFIDFCRNKGILVIYTRHCFNQKNNPIEARMFPVLWKSGLREGTEDWEICDAIKPDKKDVLVNKTRYDAFFNTKLEKILRAKDIETVIITGTMTEICCESTARSAMFHDYQVIFCSDLTFTNSRETHKNTVEVIRANFGDAWTAQKILRELGK